MSALRPIIDWMEDRKIPRLLALILIYVLVIGLIGFAIAGMIPAIAPQSAKLFTEIPNFLNRMFPYVSFDLQSLSQQIAPVGANLVNVTVGVFTNFVATLTVFTFTFYFLLERGNIKSVLSGLLGDGLGDRVFSVLLRVEKRLGAWVLGELMLMLTIGTMVFIGLFFLRVDFALPLAIMAGLLEIIPTIGPIVSAIPAILVAFSHSPGLALTVIALYLVVQQLENNFVVPMVMRKSVGLSPILTILALMIGARFAGVTGAVLAVPVLLTVQEIVASLNESPVRKR
jgi:predicted PurR-regulated permease PerM